MILNLAQLRSFVAVVDEGGFGCAARALGISQSAVSHAVAALERVLGHQVLTRVGEPSPTEFGERVLAHARSAVAAAAAIRDIADEQAGLPTGTVRLAAPPTVCQSLLPQLMKRWQERFPNVRIRVFEGEDDEVAEWLGQGVADAAVLVDPEPAAGVLLAEDAFKALLRSDHPLAGQDEIDVLDLDDDPFLLSCGGCERHIREIYRQARGRLTPTHRVHQLSTLLAMVRAEVGVSITPGLVGSVLDPQLVLVPLRQRVVRRLVLSGPSQRPWHPAVRALVEDARGLAAA
ncbi:LysR family transcriptional regulator [Solihabitans fulvus]|uniref:LysR family transcriptional regulator n=1 Tax=Solihabitans fulvus TaxID=1892852 RepID=A0A5B2XNA3_9PSEU|nr:LysR family transcriptional regulator [Solihabitans fulvus]KAA2264302.1 LysR family transcriptional regulator [Solihabitans fulvus]